MAISHIEMSKMSCFFLKLKNPDYAEPGFKIQLMPKTAYVQEIPLFTAITSYYFTLFFINSLVTFVVNVVSEKEKKIKEIMRMMGMYDSAFWLSWIAVYFMLFTIINLIVSVVLVSIGFFHTFTLTIVFFVLFELFSIVTITFGMLMSTFFTKSKTAGTLLTRLVLK
jgi:ATP-binding cassette subfamily A (ABC1) protein 5